MTPSSRDGVTARIGHALPGRLSGAERMPHAIQPMLAAETPEPFDSTDHIFELMWGGLRTMAYVHDGTVQLRARNGRDRDTWPSENVDLPDLAARENIGEPLPVWREGEPAGVGRDDGQSR